MKRIILAISAVAVVFAACSKENLTQEIIHVKENAVKVYTLSASMPQTKANVNESTGKFEWVSTDEIAVYDNAQNKYQVFTTTGSGETVDFTFTATDELEHDFNGSIAYYPASRLNEGHTSVNTPVELASAGDVPMSATNNNGNMVFDYETAVVKLTVNHMPSFALSVEFQNAGNSFAAEVTNTTNEDMTFYLAVTPSTSASSAIIVYDTNNNEIINKSFDLSGGPITKGALIPLKTTIGYPILVENGTGWEGLDIYCYSATDTWKNAEWGSSLATVKTISLGEKTYSYIIAKSTADSYSFVFRKPNADYPRVEHKGVSVSGETKIALNTTNGARVEGNTTPRLIVYNQNKQAPVYIHYWGNGINGTNWTSNTDENRQMISSDGGHMGMGDKCTGLIYTGNAVNAGDWYFYYDFSDFANTVTSFNFRLHQGENKGTEFNDVALETNMYYGWWNNNNGGTWGAGAWKM